MVLGGEDQLAGLCDAQSVFAPVQCLAGHFRGRCRCLLRGQALEHDQTIMLLTMSVNRSHGSFHIKEHGVIC